MIKTEKTDKYMYSVVDKLQAKLIVYSEKQNLTKKWFFFGRWLTK